MEFFSPLGWLSSRPPKGSCSTALSYQPSLEAAVEEVVNELVCDQPADLALVFVSTSFSSDLPRLLPLLRERLDADHWIGCVGGGVIGPRASKIKTNNK